MVPLEMEMEEKYSNMEQNPNYRRLHLTTVAVVFLIFALGVGFAFVCIYISNNANNRGCQPEVQTEILRKPTCEKGKLWASDKFRFRIACQEIAVNFNVLIQKPEDATVYTPFLVHSTHEVETTEKHLNSTFKRSHTIILDCPTDNRSSSKDHPSAVLLEHYTQLLETSNYTRKTVLPRFWLRTLTNNSGECVELVQYAIRHTPTHFEGVLMDTRMFEAHAAGDEYWKYTAAWKNLTAESFSYWNKFDLSIGVAFSTDSCVPFTKYTPRDVLSDIHKAFFFDYDREIFFSERAAYVSVSKKYRVCRNSAIGQFPIQFVLTDEHDSLNSISHSVTDILCLKNI